MLPDGREKLYLVGSVKLPETLAEWEQLAHCPTKALPGHPRRAKTYLDWLGKAYVVILKLRGTAAPAAVR